MGCRLVTMKEPLGQGLVWVMELRFTSTFTSTSTLGIHEELKKVVVDGIYSGI